MVGSLVLSYGYERGSIEQSCRQHQCKRDFFFFSGTSFQWLSCMSVWMPALKKASRKSTDPCLEISGLGFWTALRLCQKRFEEAFISVFCFVSKCCDYISGAVLVVLYMKTNSSDQFESHLEETAAVAICVLLYVSLLRQTHWITFEVIVNIRSVLWLDGGIGASSVSSAVAFLSFATIELSFHVTGNNIYKWKLPFLIAFLISGSENCVPSHAG